MASMTHSLTGFRRVAVYPGKHGNGDRRIEFVGEAPTHSETIFMLGQKALAERRYRNNGHDWLAYYAQAVLRAQDDEQVRLVAQVVERSIREKKFIPLDEA